MLGYRKSPYKELESTLGYRFRKISRLEAALTHRSYRFENDDIKEDNQRMEFLGDAVLGFVMGEYLYQNYEDKDEGFMTTLRSQTTSGKVLAEIASGINLGKFMRVGKGEERSGGRHRPSNLADALEAVIAAAYFDGGMRAVGKVFKNLFIPIIENLTGDMWADNPKGRLQEYVQRRWKSGPRYRMVQKVGPAHAVTFTVEAMLPDGSVGIGRGQSKREAEMHAATEALKLHKALQHSPGKHGTAHMGD